MNIQDMKEDMKRIMYVMLQNKLYWDEVDPRPHPTGVFVRLRKLAWYNEIIPRLNEAISLIDEIERNESEIQLPPLSYSD